MVRQLQLEEHEKLRVVKSLSELGIELNIEEYIKTFNKLYESPPKELTNSITNETAIVDEYVFRKYLEAINLMVMGEFDINQVNAGGEGTGKTTYSTQDSYTYYYILKKLKLVTYKFDEKLMYYNLSSMIDAFNRNAKVPFMIYILDEGQELQKKNWNLPQVQLFMQKIRRERKHLRIVIINLPQIGELLPDITLSRVNFIFQYSLKVNVKNINFDKGTGSFIIVPKGEYVYSPYNKKNLSQDFVLNELGKILEDKKKYFKLIPNYLIVKKVKRNGAWLIDRRKYLQASLRANEEFSLSQTNLTLSEKYYLDKFMKLKNMGVKPNTKAYYILHNLKKRINKTLGQEDKKSLEEMET